MRVVDVSYPFFCAWRNFLSSSSLAQSYVSMSTTREAFVPGLPSTLKISTSAMPKFSLAPFSAAVLTLPQPEQISRTFRTVLHAFPVSESRRRLVWANAGAQESSSVWLFMPSTVTPLPGPDFQYGELLPRPLRAFLRSGVATAIFTHRRFSLASFQPKMRFALAKKNAPCARGVCVWQRLLLHVILIIVRREFLRVRAVRVVELLFERKRRLHALLHLLWIALRGRRLAHRAQTRNRGCRALLAVLAAKFPHRVALATHSAGHVLPRVGAHLLRAREAALAIAEAEVLDHHCCGCGGGARGHGVSAAPRALAAANKARWFS